MTATNDSGQGCSRSVRTIRAKAPCCSLRCADRPRGPVARQRKQAGVAHQQHVTVVDAGENHWWVHTAGGTYHLRWKTPLPLPGASDAVAGSLRAPMPGQVIQVAVEPGQAVNRGDLLFIIEAMKTMNQIPSPRAGTVVAILIEDGQPVEYGEPLVVIE